MLDDFWLVLALELVYLSNKALFLGIYPPNSSTSVLPVFVG